MYKIIIYIYVYIHIYIYGLTRTNFSGVGFDWIVLFPTS